MEDGGGVWAAEMFVMVQKLQTTPRPPVVVELPPASTDSQPSPAFRGAWITCRICTGKSNFTLPLRLNDFVKHWNATVAFYPQRIALLSSTSMTCT